LFAEKRLKHTFICDIRALRRFFWTSGSLSKLTDAPLPTLWSRRTALLPVRHRRSRWRTTRGYDNITLYYYILCHLLPRPLHSTAVYTILNYALLELNLLVSCRAGSWHRRHTCRQPSRTL